jgi:hypothetical protein
MPVEKDGTHRSAAPAALHLIKPDVIKERQFIISKDRANSKRSFLGKKHTKT